MSLRFRLFPVRSPLLRESLLYFLFLGVLRCFSSLGLPPDPIFDFGVRILRHDPEGVSPFGDPRIEACVPLPGAYRSLPRPSSPPGAKASTAMPLVAYRALTMALNPLTLALFVYIPHLARFFFQRAQGVCL
jgi:hypothetical protein